MTSKIHSSRRAWSQAMFMLLFIITSFACVHSEDLEVEDAAAQEQRCQPPPSQGQLAEVELWAKALMDQNTLRDLEFEVDGGLALNFLVKPVSQSSGEFFFDKNVNLIVNGVEYDLRNRQRYNRTFPVQISTMTVAQYNEVYERIIPESKTANVIVVRVLIPGTKIDRSAVMKLKVNLGWDKQGETHQFQILPKCIL